MGRIENGKIVNHSGIARVRLNQQELVALVQALDMEIDYFRRLERTGGYYRGLMKLRRKLKKDIKRLRPFFKTTHPIAEKQILFVK